VRVCRYQSRKCIVGWRAERGFPAAVDLFVDDYSGHDHLGHGHDEGEVDDDDDDDEDEGGF
jgi:hypothetical protein